jgi:hypothetical protein
MVRRPLLATIQTCGIGLKGATSFITPRKRLEASSLKGPKELITPQTNGKAFSLGTTNSTGQKFEGPLRSGKEATLMWSIWNIAVAINEWRAHIVPASIFKQ